MVYGSFSTGFRVPTLHQLFDARPFSLDTNTVIFISNPRLEPQRSTGFEAGGRYDRADGSWAALSVYSVRVREEIDFDLARFAYANLGKSWHRGVELEVSQQLARGMALTASGAWTPTTIVGGENGGRQINAVPLGTAYGALRWAPNSRASFEAGARYAGRQYLDKANRHVLGDFATGEATATLRVGRLRSTLRVANLLDRRYEDTGFIGALGEERLSPAAGRTFSVAMSLE
jgi:iron complex outermembrane receptor protein